MDFDQHAFISYAHLDNEPLTPEQQGWVTRFHATLRTMLSQRLGEPARIWRDEKLDGSDVFDAEIAQQIGRAALLVSILSPRYLRSPWCTREVNEFCAAAARRGGLTVGNRSRIVKVVKTPVEHDAAVLPEIVQRTLGHEFFAIENGDPRELDPAFGAAATQQFLAKLSSLAWDLARSLQALAQAGAPAAAAPGHGPRKPVVFLADCGRDLRDVREHIATDLRMHGYELLPAQQLPLVEEALVPELRAQLARCELAVHLVGRCVGPIPDGPTQRSLVMLENELAAERARQGGLTRILWLPGGTTGERPEQQAFIEALQRDAAPQAGADLLTGDAESLKETIHATLQRLQAPPPAPAPAAADAPLVHVLINEADRSAALPLLRALRAQGCAVTLPVFSGDAAALREANGQLLAGCELLLLFHGSGDELWKFHHLNDLRKLAAVTGRAALRAPWLCLAPPSTPDKQLLVDLGEPRLIDLREGLSDAALAPLRAVLDALAASRVAAP